MTASASSEALPGSKSDLRRALLDRRRALDPAFRAAASRAIAARVCALPAFQDARTVALYAPLGAEVDTAHIAALAGSRTLLYPVVLEGARALGFAACPFGALQRGPLGAAAPPAGAPRVAPSDIDLVLVPGVAFDAAARRLGRGRGHYDATLALVRGLKVGLAFEAQLVPEVPCEAHDAPLDLVITEARLVAPAPSAGGTR